MPESEPAPTEVAPIETKAESTPETPATDQATPQESNEQSTNPAQ